MFLDLLYAFHDQPFFHKLKKELWQFPPFHTHFLCLHVGYVLARHHASKVRTSYLTWHRENRFLWARGIYVRRQLKNEPAILAHYVQNAPSFEPYLNEIVRHTFHINHPLHANPINFRFHYCHASNSLRCWAKQITIFPNQLNR